MTKEQLRVRTLSLIKESSERYAEYVEKVLDNISEKEIEKYPDDFFLPKVFHKALERTWEPKVSTRLYSISFVRSYNKTLRMLDKIVWKTMLEKCR